MKEKRRSESQRHRVENMTNNLQSIKGIEQSIESDNFDTIFILVFVHGHLFSQVSKL